MLLGIKGFDVWVIFIEDGDLVCVRLCLSGLDIDKVVNLFNGGGYVKVSGVVLNSWDEFDDFIKVVYVIL